MYYQQNISQLYTKPPLLGLNSEKNNVFFFDKNFSIPFLISGCRILSFLKASNSTKDDKIGGLIYTLPIIIEEDKKALYKAK